MTKKISVKELLEWRKSNKAHQLIDVREPHEKDIANIGGELIPLGQIPERLAEIKGDIPVIIYCRSGKRSEDAVIYATDQLNHPEIYNLTGGILAWADEIDTTIKKY